MKNYSNNRKINEVMMKKIRLTAAIGLMTMVLQSCSSVASIGAGIGMDPKLFETEAQCKKVTYPQYLKDMQVFNQAAVDQHQTLEPVMTIEKYCHLDKKEAVATKNTVDQK